MKKKQQFASEHELVSAMLAAIAEHTSGWTVYPETAGFDVLLVQDETGVQVAVEAKLALNTKVLNQILPGSSDGGWRRPTPGPDYRAVLVPKGGVENGLSGIATRLGITVLTVYNMRHDPYEGEPDPWPGYRRPKSDWRLATDLPDEQTGQGLGLYGEHWHPWCPEERLPLPEYVPDVKAGVPSPAILSAWKIKAIKLLILAERRGYVTRADMRHLQISPTIWTGYSGYLTVGAKRGQYVTYDRTPNFRAQHPRVWGEIESDIAEWSEGLELDPAAQGPQSDLPL